MTRDIKFKPDQIDILVVDDHASMRKAILRIANSMGFRSIKECSDGGEAITELAKKPYDLVILDLRLKRVSGFEVLQSIKSRRVGDDLPVIVATGESDKGAIVKVADLGANDYLLKPFQPDDLQDKIIQTLNGYYDPAPTMQATRKAERFFISHRYREALALYNEALSIDSKAARARHGLGLALAAMGKFDEAIAELRLNTTNHPNYYKSDAARGDILLSRKRPTEAIAAFMAELTVNPKQPDRQTRLGSLLLEQDRFEDSIEHFRAALKENPQHRDALMGMAKATGALDNIDKAVYYYKRIRRHHPDATEALKGMLKLVSEHGEPRRAELILRDEKKANPDRIDTYLLLASFYRKQKRYEDALVVANDLISNLPDKAEGHLLRGQLMQQMQSYDLAVAAFKKAASIAPSARALALLGVAQRSKGELSEAVNSFEQALSMAPGEARILMELAETKILDGAPRQAYYVFLLAKQAGAPAAQCSARAQLALQNCQPQSSRKAS